MPQRACPHCGGSMPCQRCAPRMRDRTIYGANYQRAKRRWAPLVATGTVRCARGADCLHAELIEGVKFGGLIRRGEPWDLGHPTGRGGDLAPEHRDCNRGAPSRARVA